MRAAAGLVRSVIERVGGDLLPAEQVRQLDDVPIDLGTVARLLLHRIAGTFTMSNAAISGPPTGLVAADRAC